MAKKATLYSPDGKKVVVDVGSSQAANYQRLGYSLTPYKSGTKFATLYGPNDERHVVAVGSEEAKKLQGEGYGLSKGSYKEKDSDHPAPEDINKELKDLGFSDSTINGLTDDQKHMFAAVGATIKSQYEANKVVPQTFTPEDLNRIFKEAQDDPNIKSFYKEQLRVGADDFTKAITSLGADYQAAKEENNRQFGFQTKELTESEAAAGRAYSGFRAQAQTRLKSDQNSIIESSKRQLQKELQGIGSGFEKTFGSDQLKGLPTSVDGISYTPTGNVAGAMEQQRLADIRQKEQDILAKESLSRGL